MKTEINRIFIKSETRQEKIIWKNSSCAGTRVGGASALSKGAGVKEGGTQRGARRATLMLIEKNLLKFIL